MGGGVSIPVELNPITHIADHRKSKVVDELVKVQLANGVEVDMSNRGLYRYYNYIILMSLHFLASI